MYLNRDMNDLRHDRDVTDVQVFLVPHNNHTPRVAIRGVLKVVAESQRLSDGAVFSYSGFKESYKAWLVKIDHRDAVHYKVSTVSPSSILYDVIHHEWMGVFWLVRSYLLALVSQG